MAQIALLDAGLPQIFNLQKTQYLLSAIKQGMIKQGMPVVSRVSSLFQSFGRI